jgi:hypothetical protein
MVEEFVRAIAGLETQEFWFFLGSVSLGAIAALRAGYRALAHKRLIEDTPTALLRSAAQGSIEIAGVARLFDGERIIAPLTGRECCWYRYSIERQQRDGKGRTRWKQVEKGISTHLFMLDDGTGTCAVDPDGANVIPSIRNAWRGNSRIPPRLSAQPGWFMRIYAHEYRYTEELLEIGKPLYALGFLRTHGGAATPADQHAETAARLRALKSDRATLLRRYDADGNGEIDVSEWEAARRDAEAETLAAHASDGSPTIAVDLLARPADQRQPFLLSAATESDLRRRHGTASLGWLALGACLAISGVLGLLGRMQAH